MDIIMHNNGFMNVLDYGVVNDGVTNNTQTIKAIIESAEKNGGGTIYFPPGKYLTGTIELKSDMTLFVDSGAYIMGSPDPADYPMITKETLKGYNREGHSGLIKAMNAERVTVTGRGVIDGQGYHWWHNPKNEHRPRAIQFINCSNVLIEGITILNSAMWTVHPICCSNVTIDGISIKNPSDSPNTDGINPESCSNVHISNCTIDVGDDCLTLKSGTEDDELQKAHACENIVVTNCTMLNGHGGVVIGSEMSGGVKNITISNCVFNGTDRGIRFKTRRKRGGSIEDVVISNIIMTNILVPFVINGYYQCGGASEDDMSLFSLEKLPVVENTPYIRNINISNIRATKVTASAGYIYMIPEMPVSGMTVSNYSIDMIDTDGKLKDKPIMAFHAPFTKGEGFFCANIKDSTFRNISVKVINGCGMEFENAEGVQVSEVRYEGPAEPIKLNDGADVKMSY